MATWRHAAARPSIRVDPVALTQALIRCPSVTPAEGGALALLDDVLAAPASPSQRPVFTRARHAGHRQSLRPHRHGDGPASVFAGHTDVVPPGDAARLEPRPVRRRDRRRRCSIGRGAVRHEGRRRRLRRGRACAHREHGDADGLDRLPDHRRRGRPGRQRHRQAARLGEGSAASASTIACSASRPIRTRSAT